MPTSPLIILTREAADNAPLADIIESTGYPTLNYPCIAIDTPLISLPVQINGHSVHDFDILCFTSKRSVSAIKSVARKIFRQGQILACVGQVTARALQEICQCSADIVAEPATGLDLAKAIIDSVRPPLFVLHICGDKPSLDLPKILTARGFQVSSWPVYFHRQPSVLPLTLQPHAMVVFFSPSAIDHFYQINPLQQQHLLWHIAAGPVTYARLEALGITHKIQAASTTENSILDALKQIQQEEKYQ
jgi:uroporphyrinogen-III synthase